MSLVCRQLLQYLFHREKGERVSLHFSILTNDHVLNALFPGLSQSPTNNAYTSASFSGVSNVSHQQPVCFLLFSHILFSSSHVDLFFTHSLIFSSCLSHHSYLFLSFFSLHSHFSLQPIHPSSYTESKTDVSMKNYKYEYM